VDACITDPPLGLGFKYKHAEKTKSPKEYWRWLAPIISECRRCLRPGGLLAVWQKRLYMRYLWEWFGEDIHILVIFIGGNANVTLDGWAHGTGLGVLFVWSPAVKGD